ncbi:pirin family protein [bacterium]|nr:pirin family protein [bacterium]
MKTVLHQSNSRGTADHGWLNSRHTFSFGHYHDPSRTHFGLLRVLNDDTVQGGEGFDTHAHNNMEIVSIPLQGALEHRDSTGRHEVICTGDVQIMSAGSGIAHSEFNHSENDPVQFLQIWIFPKERNITPRYEQKTFPESGFHNVFQTVVAPDNSNALWINQDAYLSLGIFDENKTPSYAMRREGNGVYLFVIEGKIEVAGEMLERRDAIGLNEVSLIDILVKEQAKILIIEVPMK